MRAPAAATSDSFATTQAGLRIHVDLSDPRGQHLVASRGDFNPASRVLWHRALGLHAWDTVVDVGVNYGEMLVGAPIPPSARVLGFEPNTALHPYLERTCADNDLSLDLSDQAVSDRAGTARFAVDAQWSGTSSLALPEDEDEDAGRWQFREVPLVTLDSVLSDGGAWCAKVDVEGNELAVLGGARAAMAGSAHWAMLVEILHLPVPDIARLAHAHAAYLLDQRADLLVRIPGANVDLARTMLRSGWLYPQDCLLLSPALADQVES